MFLYLFFVVICVSLTANFGNAEIRQNTMQTCVRSFLCVILRHCRNDSSRIHHRNLIK